MQGILILVHIVAALVFIVAHAVSAAAIFQVRAESDRAKLIATLNRSQQAVLIATLALVVVLIAGIWLGFLGSWWGQLWIWVSLILLVGVGIAMTPLGVDPMNNVRLALGIPSSRAKKTDPPPVAASDAELAAARSALRPELAAAIGVAALVIIIWLMLSKPF